MKAATLKLCLPVIAMTAQQTAVSLVIPPFLDGLHYPVSAIGSLISVAPILALAARLPSGLVYRSDRAPMLLAAAVIVTTLSTFLYTFATNPITFALVQGLNGFSFGAASTIYLAFFVDALPRDEDRHHAMGYYAGCLALGYSTGGFAAGYVADRFGYADTFKFASLLGLVCLVMLSTLRKLPSSPATKSAGTKAAPRFGFSLQGFLNPNVATIVVVALFLNTLHQMSNAFFPLYALAVGLTLTEVGLIRGLYSLTNAVTRPLSGLTTKRIGHRRLSRVGLPIQCLLMMLVPLLHSLAPLLTVFLIVGFIRAVILVANTISLVEDLDETRIGRGMASGIYNAAGDVGNILGPTIGGLIASMTGVARMFFVGPLLIGGIFSLSLWACRYIRPKAG
jgi:MFS family permease